MDQGHLKISMLCTRTDLETLFCVLLLVHGNEGKGRTLIMVSWSYTVLSIYDWFQLCFTGRYPNGPSSLDMFEHIYTVNSDLKPICILLPSWLGRWWVGTNYCTMRSKDHKDNMEGDPEEYWGLVDKDTKQQEELHIETCLQWFSVILHFVVFGLGSRWWLHCNTFEEWSFQEATDTCWGCLGDGCSRVVLIVWDMVLFIPSSLEKFSPQCGCRCISFFPLISLISLLHLSALSMPIISCKWLLATVALQ